MSISLGIAFALACYVGFLVFRGDWRERVGILAAVGLGLLVPQVLAAVSTAAGSASTLLSTAGW